MLKGNVEFRMSDVDCRMSDIECLYTSRRELKGSS
jgi:hypothetical protein